MLEIQNFDQLNEEFSSERAGPTGHKKRRGAKENKVKRKDSLKVRIFKIYYQIIRERNVDKSVAFFLMIVLFFQIYDLIISPVMKLPFRGSLYKEVSSIFDIIRIYPAIIRSGDVQTYWTFMNIGLVQIGLYILFFILIDISLRNQKFQMFLPIKFLQTLSMHFYWILVIPITDFFISIYECNDEGLHFMDTTLVCWQPRHAFYCALYSFGLALFVIIQIAISLFFNDARPYHTDAFTRLDTNQEVYLTMYRIILTAVSHYTTQDNFHWLVLALHFLVCIHLLKNFQNYLPYYHQEICTLYGACCLGYLWVIVNAFLVKALDQIDYRGQIIVIIIGFIFLYPVAHHIRKNRIYQILMLRSQEKIKNDLELDQFVTNFQNFISLQESNEEVEMMFLGFLYMHREECQSASCPLKSNESLYLPLTDSTSKREIFPSKDKILHQHFVNSVFLDFQKAHANILTTVMHTSYAQFLFFQMGNFHMALIELNLAQKCSTSLQQAFTIFKTKHLIEEHLIKRFRQGTKSGNSVIQQSQISLQSYAELDVTIVITFENLFNRLEKAIEQSATDHIEFWSHLDSNMIDLNVINKLGLNIINQTKKVNEIWKQLIKINPNYPQALVLYGSYLQQIKNDIEQGEEYKTQYMQVKRLKSLDDFENQFDLMFAEDTTVIIMNGSKEQQGKIIKTNQGIFKLFGYSMFEVQGHDVNILMPPVVALKHQSFLEKYFKTGKERILNNCLESFAMYRTGIIFPIHLVVKPVPSLRNDIQYIGMIKRSSRDYEYILTDENGKIDSISDGITSLLKLPISFFKEHDIPIQVIIPELCEVYKIPPKGSYGFVGDIITNFEAWNGLKDLRFIIPKNFSSSSSRAGATGTSIKPDATSEDVNSGTGTGTGTGTQTSSSSKNMKHLHGLLAPSQQQTFVGLRSPESLKSISNMFKNAEHKGQPDKYKNNLLNHVNYQNPDFDKTLKTDIQTKIYSDGDLKVKVFKIYFSKKKKNQLGRRNSESSSNAGGGQGKDEETMLHKFGMTGMSALNDKYTFQKYKELIGNAKNLDKNYNHRKLQHDIDVLKLLIDRQKKIRSHGNIMTPAEYEHAELERMIKNIQLLEQQIADMNTGDSKNSRLTSQAHNSQDNSSHGIRNTSPHSLMNKYSNASAKKQTNTSGGTDDSISQARKDGSFHNPFSAANQGSSNSKDRQSPFLPATHDDNHTGQNQQIIVEEEDKTDNQYDEDFDETRGDKKAKKKKRSDKGGETNDDNNATSQNNGKGRKNKEDPRNEFVKDYFMHNLNFDNNNTQSTNNKLAVPQNSQQKRQQLAQKLREQQQKLYLENDIIRDLHDKSRSRKERTNKDESSSYPDPTKQEDHKNELNNGRPTNDASSVKLQVEDTGSVASDTKTLMRHLRVLRNALYENYSPQSILNLKYSARFVLLVLIAMTIASFIFSKQKYDQLKENFQNVQASQERMQSITSINTATRFCTLINNGTLNRYRYGPTQDFLAKMKSDLDSKAQILQQSQNNLSQTQFDFTNENKYIINSNNITLYYNTFVEVGNSQDVNIWSAVQQVAINAYKIKDFALSQFSTSNISIWFILKNSMNNILNAVSQSTDAILDDTKILSDSNKNILMILLLVASGCLLASMIIIMPVVTKVHKDKDKLLSLFLQIDQNDVKEQLKRCKDFFSMFHNDDKGNVQNMDGGFDIDDDDKKDGEEGMVKEGENKNDGKTPSSDDIKKKEEQKQQEMSSHQQRNRFTRKNKKLKKYSTNYIMLLLKFFIVITFMESYFLYQYFQSDNFLMRSLEMIKEAAAITNRNFSNFLLYQIIIEIIATNGTATVFNQQSTTYIMDYLDDFNQELEKFLQVHSDNVKHHDDAFNNFFDSLIYKSVCDTIEDYFTADEKAQCQSYLGGVLEKGLYSANLAFWDDMREIRDQFFKSDRSLATLKAQINNERIIQDEKLNEIYFSKAYKILMSKQNESITVQFDNRNKEIVILFAIYLFLLMMLYFILWGRFVESTRHSLWVTKSMLAIIPLEVIEKVKVIKDFLMSTSRAAMRSMKE